MGGAAVMRIFSERSDKQLPNVDCQTLATSYRSSPRIMEAVNQIFMNLTKHNKLDDAEAAVAAWQAVFPEHSVAEVKQDLDGYACLQVAPKAEDGVDQSDTNLEFGAAEIARLNQECPDASIGVLTRTNQSVGQLIYLLRSRHGIRASEEGGNPLTDSAAVDTILSLLRIADHPSDTIARYHVARSPLGETIDFTDHRNSDAANRLAISIRRELTEAGYGSVIYRWSQSLVEACDLREATRLQQLLELAHQYDSRATLRADDFVTFVESKRISDPSSANVRVMTVHQAKGLEFDIVVLPELDKSGSFPGQPDPFMVGRPAPNQPADRVCKRPQQRSSAAHAARSTATCRRNDCQ